MKITHELIREAFIGVNVYKNHSSELFVKLENVVKNDPPEYEYELGDILDQEIKNGEIWYTFSILNFDKSSDYNEEYMPYVMISWSGKDGYEKPEVEYDTQ